MDRDKDGILEGTTLGVSLVVPDGLALGTNEGIILGSTDGDMLSPSLQAADGIYFGLDEVTEINCFLRQDL